MPNSQGNLQLLNLCCFIKAPLNTHLVYWSDSCYPQKESIDDNTPRTLKRQERAMGSRRNPGTHRETRLNRLRFRPKSVKILLPAQGAGQHDFEGLLWGQKVLEASAHSILNPRPTSRRNKCPGTKWKESKLLECIAKDDPVLGRPKSWEKKLPHRPRTSTQGSLKRFQAIWASHRGIGREAAPGKAVTSVLNTHN